MGEQLDLNRFRIVDFTVDMRSGSDAHFVREADYHIQVLDHFFDKTDRQFSRFNYLGEWHSHPRFSVYPSATDISSMRALVEGERNISFALLLIVRLNWILSLECSGAFFLRGRDSHISTLIK